MYKCESCGHASGYHVDNDFIFGHCRILECGCEQFAWNEEDYKMYVKGKQGETE